MKHQSKYSSLDREGGYIRIRVILLGETASSIRINQSYHDVAFYSITQKEELETEAIKKYIANADIVLLLTSVDDDFAVKHICEVTEILQRQETLYVKIIANEEPLPVCKHRNSDIFDTNLLIVEKQKDPTIRAKNSTLEKMETILNALCKVIDNEINLFRVHENDCSALITLESFFEHKGELNIYVNYTHGQLKKALEDGTILQSQLEQASKVWMKFDSTEKSSQTIIDCIELIEENIDEDADVYFYSNEGMGYTNISFLLKKL